MKKDTSTLRMVVIVAAIVAAAALALAAVFGLATGFRGIVKGTALGGMQVDESKSFPAAGITTITVEAVSETVRIVDSTGTSA